jgi:adenosylhomocysteine nucleosidase
MPEELAAVRRELRIDGAPEACGPTLVWRGTYGGQAVVLALGGIGKVNAAAAATLLVAVHGADALIFSGVAGGIAPDLPVGAVLLADRVAVHDFGYVAAGRFTPTASGIIPIGAPTLAELPPVPDAVAERLARLADRVRDRLGHPIRLGAVTTADYFLNCAVTRQDLRARLGADAIDMESGAVAQVAEAWGVPLHVIRTLSDLAGEDSHVTYLEMIEMASANSAVCVPELLAMLADEMTPRGTDRHGRG